MARTFLDLERDLKFLREDGYSRVVGIDEVGRGSWAGPVAVGAYVLDASTPHLPGVNDSKMLKSIERENLSKVLSLHLHSIHLGKVEQINAVGIGRTIVDLIFEIVEKYNSVDTLFIIDGQFKENFGKNSIKVIRGDSTYYSVAAASILAKVFRDNLMRGLHDKFPNYGFNTNVGYPTKVHLESLRKFGQSTIHRTSFKPLHSPT